MNKLLIVLLSIFICGFGEELPTITLNTGFGIQILNDGEPYSKVYTKGVIGCVGGSVTLTLLSWEGSSKAFAATGSWFKSGADSEEIESRIDIITSSYGGRYYWSMDNGLGWLGGGGEYISTTENGSTYNAEGWYMEVGGGFYHNSISCSTVNFKYGTAPMDDGSFTFGNSWDGGALSIIYQFGIRF